MLFLNKTLSVIISAELTGHPLISKSNQDISVRYVINALLLMPWFFRYPLSAMILSVNLLSLILKGKVFFKLKSNQALSLWGRLSAYPGYSSLKRLIRTFTLLSAYSDFQYEKNYLRLFGNWIWCWRIGGISRIGKIRKRCIVS